MTVLWLCLSEKKAPKSALCGRALLFYGFCFIVGTKQTQIQKACFQPPERLIHNDFKLFLSGFPPMSCYWLIARDQGATWGKQNFHRWFIYPLHHLSTLSSCLRNLKCPQAPTLSPQGHSVDLAAKAIWLWFKKQKWQRKFLGKDRDWNRIPTAVWPLEPIFRLI